jgi:hypothetical protein
VWSNSNGDIYMLNVDTGHQEIALSGAGIRRDQVSTYDGFICWRELGQIWFWDGLNVMRVSPDPNSTYSRPIMDVGGTITWKRVSSGVGYVEYWDGTEVTFSTPANYSPLGYPFIDDSRVAWTSNGNVFYWDVPGPPPDPVLPVEMHSKKFQIKAKSPEETSTVKIEGVANFPELSLLPEEEVTVQTTIIVPGARADGTDLEIISQDVLTVTEEDGHLLLKK